MGTDSKVGAPIARFKELCLDTCPPPGTDRDALGLFWARATGCEYVPVADGPGDVIGAEEGMGIALCPVPEPKTVKHRVHLDISTTAISDVLELGAVVLREPDESIRWTVMADPEGGEFCAFVQPPERLAPYRVFELVVDCADAESTAHWWAEIFGVEVMVKDDYFWFSGAPGFPSPAVAPFWAMVFGTVPEPKTVKNRLHWDVYGDVETFLSRGARLLWKMPRWTVLADPEGNEFCVFPEPDA